MDFLKQILISFFPRDSFQGSGTRICRFRRFLRAACRMGVASLLDARTILRVTRVGLFLVLVALDAARLSPRVLFMICQIRCTANAVEDVVIAGACGEHNLDDHVVAFRNLQLAASAELGCALNCLNSLNSLFCHPYACAFSCTSY